MNAPRRGVDGRSEHGLRAAPVGEVHQLLLGAAAGEVIVVTSEDHDLAVRLALHFRERRHQSFGDALGKGVLADPVLHADLQDVRRDQLQVDGFLGAHVAPSHGNWPVFT